MADRYLLVDDVTNRQKRGGAVGGFTDQDFDVGGGGQTTFLSGTSFSGGTKIDVIRNGTLMREGGSFDYTRNTGTSQIIFNYTVLQNAWVRIRIYS